MVTCMVFFGCGTKEETLFENEKESVENSEETSEKIMEDSEQEYDYPFCVYVCGQVKYPGVYELPQGSRICDAIEAAGGFTDSASMDYWNQAETITDGEMIYVPTVDEALERSTLSNEPSETSEVDDGKININTASKELLTSISGIGNSRAESIIKYRDQNGFFDTIDEIKNVSGIGDSIFESIKDYISVN